MARLALKREKENDAYCIECDVIVSDEELYCKACLRKFFAEVPIIKVQPNDVPTEFIARSDFQPEGVPVKKLFL